MQQKEKLIKVVERPRVVIGLRDDGILHVYYKPYTEIDVTLQKEAVGIYNELCEGNTVVAIFEAGEFCSVTKEARENAIAMEAVSPIRASVVYVTNVAYKLIADFYYHVNRPKHPYKVVRNFDDGINWLKQVRSASKSIVG